MILPHRPLSTIVLHCGTKVDRPSAFRLFRGLTSGLSLKVLTRLAQADDLKIEVKVSAKLKEAQTLEQLNAALKELGIADHFRKD